MSELVDDSPLLQLRTLRSRLANRSTAMTRFRNYHSAWMHSRGEDAERNNNMNDGDAFDNFFISTLELIEEGSDDTNQADNGNETNIELANMNRLSQRERTTRLARLRRNVARMRRERGVGRRDGSRAVPLAEPLGEDVEIS